MYNLVADRIYLFQLFRVIVSVLGRRAVIVCLVSMMLGDSLLPPTFSLLLVVLFASRLGWRNFSYWNVSGKPS